jgi:hypothetical protein
MKYRGVAAFWCFSNASLWIAGRREADLQGLAWPEATEMSQPRAISSSAIELCSRDEM